MKCILFYIFYENARDKKDMCVCVGLVFIVNSLFPKQQQQQQQNLSRLWTASEQKNADSKHEELEPAKCKTPQERRDNER